MDYDYGDVNACNAFHMSQIHDMQSRLVRHIANGNTTDVVTTSSYNQASAYTSPNQLEQEKSEVFRKLPLLACLSSDLPKSGDFLTMDAVGLPVVITRDRSGSVNAFLNMCMHRGATVASGCGHASRLVCRFHGWSYDLNGRLASIPGASSFKDVEEAKHNLIRIPSQEWNGMIFVIASPNIKTIDVEAYLGDFAPQLAMLRLSDTVPVNKSQLATQANWKCMLDTHGEGYHFATLHPKTIAPGVISNVAVYDCYGPHYRVSFAQKTHADMANNADHGDDVTNYSSSMLLFPNTIIFVSTFNLGKKPHEFKAGKLDTSAFYYGIYRLFPGASPGITHTHMSTYRPTNPSPHIEHGAWGGTHDFVEKVLIEEDYNMAAEQFRNLSEAPADHHVLYGANEIGVQHFHAELARRMVRSG